VHKLYILLNAEARREKEETAILKNLGAQQGSEKMKSFIRFIDRRDTR